MPLGLTFSMHFGYGGMGEARRHEASGPCPFSDAAPRSMTTSPRRIVPSRTRRTSRRGARW